MKTPRSKWVIGLMAVVLYLANPWVQIDFLIKEADRGAFPPDGDSMGIPVFSIAGMFMMFLPVYVGIVWILLTRYKGGLSFLAFNRHAWVKSTLWTVILGSFIFLNGAMSAIFLFGGEIPLGTVSVLNMYWLMCLRSSLAHDPYELIG